MKIPAGLCVGCGLCVAACPHGALRMATRRDGRPAPDLDRNMCVRCGVCETVCPQENQRLRDLAERTSRAPDPARVGLEGASCNLAWDSHDLDGRRLSSSGGVVTALARRLLADGAADGVVHVKRILAGRGEPHFAATLSRTDEEVASCRGSAYEAIDFSSVFGMLEPGKRYFVTGTPCLVRGVRRLASSPRFRSVRFITCALVCSHNVTPQLIDALADRHGIPKGTRFSVNLRDKDGIENASKFNTRYVGEDGRDLLKMERTASGWTKIWRSYAFALEACCYCPDFWGGEADVSVKDAWGRKEWKRDPLGKSILIVRNHALERPLRACGLAMEPLAVEDVAYTQPAETSFKQAAAADKFRHCLLHPANWRNGLLRRRLVAAVSKWMVTAICLMAASWLSGKSLSLDLHKVATPGNLPKSWLVSGGGTVV